MLHLIKFKKFILKLSLAIYCNSWHCLETTGPKLGKCLK
ncbi:hypothetical protein X975_12963, partial [Stegodyphus mimosarum]